MHRKTYNTDNLQTANSVCKQIRRLACLAAWAAAILWVAGVSGTAVADTGTAGRQVLDLINQYRQAPYAHATALGYSPEHLASIGILPETGFPPYEADDDLFLAASEANALAIFPDTPAEDTLSETPVEDPQEDPAASADPSASANGTAAVSSGSERQETVQTGAVLTFSNFIAGETAATLFAENLLKNELNTGAFEYVLASAYSHAGASVDPGVQAGRNAWFSTLVLGSPARITDMQMLHLINQVRAEPERAETYLSAGLDTLFEQNQQIYLLPTLRFQPLFLDSLLYELAKADVLTPEAVFFGPDNRMVLKTETGEKTWTGEWFQEMTAAVSWADMNQARPVTSLFTALLLQELSVWPYNAVIFSNYYTEAGPFVHLETDDTSGTEAGTGLETEQESPESPVQSGSGVVTLCTGSAAPVSDTDPSGAGTALPAPGTVRIYGLVFLDHDGDSLYAPGDELAGETVAVYPLSVSVGDAGLASEDGSGSMVSEPVYQAITDNAGYFSVSLEPGQYWVFETWKQEQVSRRILYIDTDRFVKMSFYPPDLQ